MNSFTHLNEPQKPIKLIYKTIICCTFNSVANYIKIQKKYDQ